MAKNISSYQKLNREHFEMEDCLNSLGVYFCPKCRDLCLGEEEVACMNEYNGMCFGCIEMRNKCLVCKKAIRGNDSAEECQECHQTFCSTGCCDVGNEKCPECGPNADCEP